MIVIVVPARGMTADRFVAHQPSRGYGVAGRAPLRRQIR